jgi:hypothetical protein
MKECYKLDYNVPNKNIKTIFQTLFIQVEEYDQFAGLNFFNSLLAIRITLDSISYFAVTIYMTGRGLSNDKSSLTFS